MNMEEEAAQSTIHLQQVQDELSYVKQNASKETDFLQQQLLMYEEKFAVMENRLALVFLFFASPRLSFSSSLFVTLFILFCHSFNLFTAGTDRFGQSNAEIICC